jgi:hypothetical protein
MTTHDNGFSKRTKLKKSFLSILFSLLKLKKNEHGNTTKR